MTTDSEPRAVLVVRADAPPEVTQMEVTLSGDYLDWCAPCADLGTATWDLILLAGADRSPDMVDWVAAQVRHAVRPGGKYQWRDKQ